MGLSPCQRSGFLAHTSSELSANVSAGYRWKARKLVNGEEKWGLLCYGFPKVDNRPAGSPAPSRRAQAGQIQASSATKMATPGQSPHKHWQGHCLIWAVPRPPGWTRPGCAGSGSIKAQRDGRRRRPGGTLAPPMLARPGPARRRGPHPRPTARALVDLLFPTPLQNSIFMLHRTINS